MKTIELNDSEIALLKNVLKEAKTDYKNAADKAKEGLVKNCLTESSDLCESVLDKL